MVFPAIPQPLPSSFRPILGGTSPFAKDGYFHNWAAGSGSNLIPASGDPNSATDYCYTTSPEVLTVEWQRAFAIDGSGRMYYDPTGAEIACPIPSATDLLEAPRPAFAVDFSRRGLWRYDGNDGWIRLARSNPVLVRARGETDLATFKGKKGLYHLDDAGWTRIAKWTATEFSLSKAASSRSFAPSQAHGTGTKPSGCRSRRGNRRRWKSKGTSVVDFGPEGVWFFWKPFGWTRLSDQDPSFVYAGRYLIADVADGQGAQWIFVSDLHEPWILWTPFDPSAPEAALEFRRNPYGHNIALDLGVGGGIRLNNSQATPWDPYLLSHLDDDLLAAFRGRGLYRFEDETSWVELSASEPTELAPADTYVGALFDDNDLKGVHRFDDSGSQQITRWRAASVTAVDLAAASQSWRLRRARRCPVPKSERNKDSCRRLVRRTNSP